MADTNEISTSSHTHWHNAVLPLVKAVLPLVPRAHHSSQMLLLSLCLSLQEKHSHWLFPLRDTFPRSHVQNLPASVSDVDEVKSFTLNAVPPRDELKCHFGHQQGEVEREVGEKGWVGGRWERASKYKCAC